MEINDAVTSLAALAQDTRLEIFRALVRAGPQGLSAGTVADTLGVPASTLSFHFKELRHAGVVSCRRQGRSIIYAPDFAAMASLIDFLTENCCAGAGDADCGQPAGTVLRDCG